MFIGEMNFEEFAHDRRTFLAVSRCLEIVSEASRRLTDAFKAEHQEVPWRDIADTGNVYRHQYNDVAPRAAYETAKYDLPALLIVIDAEVERLDAA